MLFFVILSAVFKIIFVLNYTSGSLNELEKQVTLGKLAENEGYCRKKISSKFDDPGSLLGRIAK